MPSGDARTALLASSSFYISLSRSPPLTGASADSRRRAVDWIIYFWARFSMTVCGYSPEVVGLENLPPHGETCLYVPNHTSFMDSEPGLSPEARYVLL